RGKKMLRGGQAGQGEGRQFPGWRWGGRGAKLKGPIIWKTGGYKKKRQTPAATKPVPDSREMRRPAGTTFSASTKTARTAIHKTFITPPTNSSVISAQQQPMQKAP